MERLASHSSRRIKLRQLASLASATVGRQETADGAEYAGVYWTGTAMAVIDDLGSDFDQAIDEFREFLREHGEA